MSSAYHVHSKKTYATSSKGSTAAFRKKAHAFRIRTEDEGMRTCHLFYKYSKFLIFYTKYSNITFHKMGQRVLNLDIGHYTSAGHVLFYHRGMVLAGLDCS